MENSPRGAHVVMQAPQCTQPEPSTTGLQFAKSWAEQEWHSCTCLHENVIPRFSIEANLWAQLWFILLLIKDRLKTQILNVTNFRKFV